MFNPFSHPFNPQFLQDYGTLLLALLLLIPVYRLPAVVQGLRQERQADFVQRMRIVLGCQAYQRHSFVLMDVDAEKDEPKGNYILASWGDDLLSQSKNTLEMMGKKGELHWFIGGHYKIL